MSKIQNMRKSVYFSLFATSALAAILCVSLRAGEEAHISPDEDFRRLSLKIGLDFEDIREVMSGTYMTVEQFRRINHGTARLLELNPSRQEFQSLDPMFGDGVTAAEFLTFLMEFGRNPPNVAPKEYASEDMPIEEVVAYAYSFDAIPMDPEKFSVSQIHYLRGVRERANELYSKGLYGKAFPLLLGLAKRGFRDAQSRLSYILMNGADGVPKSNLRAIGWLGAASAHPTEPGFRSLFKRHLRDVPDHARTTVDRVVEAYRREFSHPDRWVCSTNHKFYYSSSIIKSTHCKFRLEAIAEACRPGNCWADNVNASYDADSHWGMDRLDNRLEEMMNDRMQDILNRDPR